MNDRPTILPPAFQKKPAKEARSPAPRDSFEIVLDRIPHLRARVDAARVWGWP